MFTTPLVAVLLLFVIFCAQLQLIHTDSFLDLDIMLALKKDSKLKPMTIAAYKYNLNMDRVISRGVTYYPKKDLCPYKDDPIKMRFCQDLKEYYMFMQRNHNYNTESWRVEANQRRANLHDLKNPRRCPLAVDPN